MSKKTPVPITYESFLGALGKAVADRGEDYIYRNSGVCEYIEEDGSVGCIVGYALTELGYTPENTPLMAHGTGKSATSVLESLGVDNLVVDAARHAQMLQDSRRSWGAALRAYQTHYNYVRNIIAY